MMKLFFAVVALFVGVAVAEGDVLQLTKDNFDSTVKNADIILVKFYAPWCGHCKHLAPEYVKAAATLKKNDPPVLLGEVDCTVETELASKYGISGYPTLKIFRKGAEAPYNGPREANGIVNYMRANAGPAAKVLSTVEQFNAFVKGELAVVAFLTRSSVAEKLFLDFAEKQREEFRFAVVYEESVAKEKNAEFGSVVLYRPYDGEDKQVVSSPVDLSSAAKLSDFVFRSSVPFSGFYEASLAKRYTAVGLPRVTLCAKVNRENEKSKVRYYANRMRKAGAAYKGKLLFALQSSAEKECEEFGYKSAETGLGVVSGGQRYKAESEELQKFSVAAVEKLAGEFLAGNVPKHIKSEPTPEKNDEPVRILTGKTFDEEVMNSDKDVFITFYAPWCGHCKSLHPKWEEMAKKMLPYRDQVTVAKLDATANDYPPQFKVQGFPTIYLSKASDRAHPVQYQGEREAAALETWLRNSVSRKLVAKEEL